MNTYTEAIFTPNNVSANADTPLNMSEKAVSKRPVYHGSATFASARKIHKLFNLIIRIPAENGAHAKDVAIVHPHEQIEIFVILFFKPNRPPGRRSRYRGV